MTHLRKMMLEELERRNYAETTKECCRTEPDPCLGDGLRCLICDISDEHRFLRE